MNVVATFLELGSGFRIHGYVSSFIILVLQPLT